MLIQRLLATSPALGVFSRTHATLRKTCGPILTSRAKVVVCWFAFVGALIVACGRKTFIIEEGTFKRNSSR